MLLLLSYFHLLLGYSHFVTSVVFKFYVSVHVLLDFSAQSYVTWPIDNVLSLQMMEIPGASIYDRLLLVTVFDHRYLPLVSGVFKDILLRLFSGPK